MKLTNVSIENKTSVLIFILMIVILGVTSYVSLPREASPDITIPVLLVSTPYSGVSPNDIESLITQPIEKEIKSISDVKEITSSSFEGFSLVRVEFNTGVDIDDALQKVRDKVNRAESKLPSDVEKPMIVEINFSEFPILMINVSGPVGLVKLKDIADDLKDEIEKIPGILDVKISGGLEREVKVNVDVEKMKYYNVRFDDIINSISNENKNIPGGSVDVGNSSFLVRVPGEFTAVEPIKDIIVKMKDGYPIYVRDLATVEFGFKDRGSYARNNLEECVTLSVSKRVGENIIDVSDQVKKILSDKKSSLPSSINMSITVDQAKMINRMVMDLENNIFSGLVLVVLVLLFFMGVRNSLFVAIAIPLSMLISFFILDAMGITLNMVVLFSLILALGMLVDNAIVIVENIYKYLEEGSPIIEAAKKGTAEVAWPVTTSTLTTLAAFFPMIFWPGIVGEFMSFLPITLIVTLTSSLIVALVINPVICARFMRLEKKEIEKKTISSSLMKPLNRVTHFFNDKLLSRVLKIYENALRKSLGESRIEHSQLELRNWIGFLGVPFGFGLILIDVLSIYLFGFGTVIIYMGGIIIGLIILLHIVDFLFGGLIRRLFNLRGFILTDPKARVMWGAVSSLVLVMMIYFSFSHGVEFFPKIQPQEIFLDVIAPKGTSIDMSNRIVSQVEEKFSSINKEDITDIVANVGTSTNPFDGGASTPYKSRMTIKFVDLHDRKISSFETQEMIRDSVSMIAGARVELTSQQMGPPTGLPVNIEISGDDYDELGRIASQIKEKIKNVSGLVDLKDNYDGGRPELRVDIDREKAALFGMNTAQVAGAIRTAINGSTASKFRISDEEYDITVRLRDDQRNNIEAIKDLPLLFNNKQGKTIQFPLNSVANIEVSTGAGSINRKDLTRVITVSANTEDRNENEVLSEVKEIVATMTFPADYNVSFTGQNQEQQKASAFLTKAFLIAILLIFFILVAQFNSLAQPLIIMTAVGISLVGVFIGLTIFALPFGIIMTGIGVISLAGVVVNNNIVLIDYMNLIRRKGLSAVETAVQAGLRRFRPVTLTAVTTILGLVPLSFGIDFDIHEFKFTTGGESAMWWRGMGISVIFGLSFATVLTLIIVPVIYNIVEEIPLAIEAYKIKIRNVSLKLIRR